MTSPKQTDKLVERLLRREHHYRNAVEGEYDATLMQSARLNLTALAEEVKWKDATLGGAAMDLNFARREFLREGNKEAAAMMECGYKAVIAALTKDQQQ